MSAARDEGSRLKAQGDNTILDAGPGFPLEPRALPAPARCTLHERRTTHDERRPSGLTLVELLVAMAILVTVSASTALIFRGITRAWRTGQLRTERYQQARLLFDVFGREICSSVANPRYPMIGTEPSAEIRIHRGSVFAELFFVGTLPGRSGLVERGYWVDEHGVLMCHDDEPADGNYATGTSELCGQDISQFTAAYFDGTEWRDRWDGRAPGEEGALPKAIHIVLVIGAQKPERFETVIHVPTS